MPAPGALTRGLPAHAVAVRAGSLPDHSCGTAPDSHRVPPSPSPGQPTAAKPAVLSAPGAIVAEWAAALIMERAEMTSSSETTDELPGRQAEQRPRDLKRRPRPWSWSARRVVGARLHRPRSRGRLLELRHLQGRGGLTSAGQRVTASPPGSRAPARR